MINKLVMIINKEGYNKVSEYISTMDFVEYGFRSYNKDTNPIIEYEFIEGNNKSIRIEIKNKTELTCITSEHMIDDNPLKLLLK